MAENTSEDGNPVKPVSEKADERNAWGEDQEKHRYYYDDAHGYETYDPEADEEDEGDGPGSVPRPSN